MGYKINFKFDDLTQLYEEYRQKYGENIYKYITKLLQETKKLHKKAFFDCPQVKEKQQKNILVDHEQSWRAFKGKNLEKLIQYMIKKEIEDLGLCILNGNSLEKRKKLSEELSYVKRNLAIDYGEFGLHLPDVDMIIYKPTFPYKVLAVLSSKVTLRERIAQTGYWKYKLLQDKVTKHIKVYFLTLDEDGTLTHKFPTKKGRAIAEIDLDCTYILTEENIEESDKIKSFEHFIKDLKKLLKAQNKSKS